MHKESNDVYVSSLHVPCTYLALDAENISIVYMLGEIYEWYRILNGDLKTDEMLRHNAQPPWNIREAAFERQPVVSLVHIIYYI